MNEDEIWTFYIRSAEQSLQSVDSKYSELIASILVKTDEFRKAGDCLDAIIAKWESVHEAATLPKTWALTPLDITDQANDYNTRVLKIEKLLRSDPLKLETLENALGSAAWRNSIYHNISNLENKVSEIIDRLLKLFGDVPKEIKRLNLDTASGSSEDLRVVDSLDARLKEVTASALKVTAANALSLEGLELLLTGAVKTSFAEIQVAEQKIKESQLTQNLKHKEIEKKKTTKRPKKVAGVRSKIKKSSDPGNPVTWFYLNEKNEAQPADLSLLANLINNDLLTRQSQVWREGWIDWRELGKVKELSEFLQSSRVTNKVGLDQVCDEVIDVLSVVEIASFDEIFNLVYFNLLAKHGVRDSQEVFRLRLHEAISNLVAGGLIKKKMWRYRMV